MAALDRRPVEGAESGIREAPVRAAVAAERVRACFDEVDARIINTLQGGFPLSERPYRDAARSIGLDEDELIARLRRLLDTGVLTRFGPMLQAERLGGEYLLAAMQVPEEEFERIAGLLGTRPEVAHNYRREHRFNMWFVLAADTRAAIGRTVEWIEATTGLCVLQLPKEREYFVQLKLVAEVLPDAA
jgi:siroheme decarboxylase